MAYAYGHGANGKSVLHDTWRGIMGEYARHAAMETFVEARGERHSTGIADLAGARLVTATETEQGRVWSEALIKDLTGGEVVTARFMRQDFFTFRPVCKLAFQGNHLPALRSTDIAMRRRFRLIPFEHEVPTDKRDPVLARRLEDEWPAILRWMLDGLEQWRLDGLGASEAVDTATGTYFDENDTIGQWLQTECQTHDSPTHETPAARLYECWKGWCNRSGYDPGTSTAFGRTLGRKGYAAHKRGGTVYRQRLTIVRNNQDS